MKKALITGGAGFVGYHLAKRLVAHGYVVVIADNLSRGKCDDDFQQLLSQPSVQLVEVDLTQFNSWEKLGEGFDEVYHLAGINGTRNFYGMPHEVLRVGVLTTVHALEWFRLHNKKSNAKILYTSSNEAYAGALEAFGTLPIPTPEQVPLVIADTYNPRWSYAGQKLVGELFFIHYAKAYDLRMTIVRPHNFYGPRAGYQHAIPEIVDRVCQKTDPFPLFGADETRSFCYIDDAVEAIHVAMTSKTTDGGTYHIGSREETSIRDLAENIFELTQWRPKNTETKPSPPGSVKRRLPDVSKIKRDTGWEAKTSLKNGLRPTIEWYLARPKPAPNSK